jgi:hypothetical protein
MKRGQGKREKGKRIKPTGWLMADGCELRTKNYELRTVN